MSWCCLTCTCDYICSKTRGDVGRICKNFLKSASVTSVAQRSFFLVVLLIPGYTGDLSAFPQVWEIVLATLFENVCLDIRIYNWRVRKACMMLMEKSRISYRKVIVVIVIYHSRIKPYNNACRKYVQTRKSLQVLVWVVVFRKLFFIQTDLGEDVL